jgi:hypothetical protein
VAPGATGLAGVVAGGVVGSAGLEEGLKSFRSHSSHDSGRRDWDWRGAGAGAGGGVAAAGLAGDPEILKTRLHISSRLSVLGGADG